MMSWYHEVPMYRWKDRFGVVHFVGLHTSQRVAAECGVLIASGRRRSFDRYEESFDVPTCLRCVAIVVSYE